MNEPQPIGACALLLDTNGRVLLGKRKNSYKASYYGLPGGRIELNEPVAEAIRREVLEETGITLNVLRYLGVVRENQDGYDFIHFVFIAENVNQQPQLLEPEKCEGWEWIDPNDMQVQVLPGHQAAIKLYIHNEQIIDLIQ